MLPPRLVRRLVLAPMVIVLACGLIVLSPLLLLLALLSGLAGLLRAGRMRNLRLVSFLVVWLTAEIVTLLLLFGLWIVSGFGGRLHTEPYQSRHYAVVCWFLDSTMRPQARTITIGASTSRRTSRGGSIGRPPVEGTPDNYPVRAER